MTGQWKRFWALLARDGLLLALCLGLWRWLPAGGLSGAGIVTLQIATGLMTVVIGFLLHEWGHLIGAWISGSAYTLPASPFETPFLFRFNNVRNSRGQFCAMSLGGFVSSTLFVAVLVMLLPRGLASAIALGLTSLGVLAVLATEVPGLIKVMRGAPIPGGAAYVSDP
jgi:hypothetical protein